MWYADLMSTIHSIDTHNSLLIISIVIISLYLLREIFDPLPWKLLVIGPALLVSAFVGAALMKVHSIFISSLEPINTVLGAVIGITAIYVLGAIFLLLLAAFDQYSLGRLYRSRYKHSNAAAANPVKKKTEVPIDPNDPAAAYITEPTAVAAEPVAHATPAAQK